MLGMARVAAFWIGFLALAAVCHVYRFVLILVPCFLSARYRRRFYVPVWNVVIRFWGRSVYALCRFVAGMRPVVVEGTVPDGRCVVVANHQSTADIPILFEVLRDKNVKFVVKKELLRSIPFASTALREGGFGVVDFDHAWKTIRGLTAFAHELPAWDGTPLIFPEGRRTDDGSLAPFHAAGIELLARATGLPVVPVVVDGLWRARTARDFFAHLPGSRCRVRILPAISGGDAALDRGNLTRTLHEAMSAELGRMRGDAPVPAR